MAMHPPSTPLPERKRKQKHLSSSGSSGSSGSPFSTMSTEKAQQLLQITFVKLERGVVANFSKLKDPVELLVLPPEVKEKIYKTICGKLNAFQYPVSSVPKSTKKIFVAAMTTVVVNQINKEFGNRLLLETETAVIGQEYSFGKKHVGIMDYVGSVENSNKKLYLVMMECKKSGVSDGIKQCCLFLKRMSDSNGDNDRVFGFSTSGYEWILITYDPVHGFQIMHKQQAMFLHMEDSKEKWISECSYIFDVLYTCFSQKFLKNIE